MDRCHGLSGRAVMRLNTEYKFREYLWVVPVQWYSTILVG